MANAGGPAWRGRRTPNRRLALGVLSLSAALLLVALYRWMHHGEPVRWWFMSVFVLFLFIYGALVLTSRVDVELELGADALVLDVRELAVGRQVRQRTHRVRRARIAKVAERTFGMGVQIVRVEDASGRALVTFPRFLDLEEHDRMIEAILEWGGQVRPVVDSGSSPGPEAR